MGGFGAMSYAGRHPELFRGAASSSGILDTTHPTAAPIFAGPYPTWLMQTFLQPLGYDPLALFGDPMTQADIWAAHNPADLVEHMRGISLYVSCGNGELGPLDPPGTDPSGLLALLEAALLRQNQEFVRASERTRYRHDRGLLRTWDAHMAVLAAAATRRLAPTHAGDRGLVGCFYRRT